MTALNKAAITQAILLTADERLEDCLVAARLAVAAIHHSANVLDRKAFDTLAADIDAALITAQTLSGEMHREVEYFCAETEFARNIEFRHLRDGALDRDAGKIIELLTHRRSLKKKD